MPGEIASVALGLRADDYVPKNSLIFSSDSLRADIVPESSKSTGLSALGMLTDFLRSYLFKGGFPTVVKVCVSHASGGEGNVLSGSSF